MRFMWQKFQTENLYEVNNFLKFKLPSFFWYLVATQHQLITFNSINNHISIILRCFIMHILISIYSFDEIISYQIYAKNKG